MRVYSLYLYIFYIVLNTQDVIILRFLFSSLLFSRSATMASASIAQLHKRVAGSVAGSQKGFPVTTAVSLHTLNV